MMLIRRSCLVPKVRNNKLLVPKLKVGNVWLFDLILKIKQMTKIM